MWKKYIYKPSSRFFQKKKKKEETKGTKTAKDNCLLMSCILYITCIL